MKRHFAIIISLLALVVFGHAADQKQVEKLYKEVQSLRSENVRLRTDLGSSLRMMNISLEEVQDLKWLPANELKNTDQGVSSNFYFKVEGYNDAGKTITLFGAIALTALLVIIIQSIVKGSRRLNRSVRGFSKTVLSK